MPRPTLSARKPGAAGAEFSQNPITNWLEKRKERRIQAENESARLITNKIAHNENVIIDKLSSIDFFNSKLPKAVLEKKRQPEDRCCELEYATRAIVHAIRSNPQTIKMDIRKIDQKILTLVLLFKQAVELGDKESAYAARACLSRAIYDIRCRIPQDQPELSRLFVDANTEYLDQLITLVLQAQQTDRIQENVNNQRKLLEKAEQDYKESLDRLEEMIKEDPKQTKAYNALRQRTTVVDRSNWTKEEREIHSLLIERRMDEVNLNLKRQILQQQETHLMTTKGKTEILFTHAANMPIPTDPDLMSKYQEGIDNLFKQMLDTDAQIESALKTMDDIEGRMQQLNRASGSKLAMEVATEGAKQLLADIHAKQQIETGEAALQQKKLLEELGILSDEQLAEQKKQNEERLKAQEAEILAEQEQELERIPN